MALVMLFVVAYVIYGSIAWNSARQPFDLVVPVVFFSGAVFVLLVTSISLQTAADIQRIAILEEENVTDPLTGIYNRRYMDRRLKEEVARANRYGFPLSVLLLDIDHFKQLNDRCGHHFGDVVLNAVGQAIAKSARISDVVARYGGEEILVIAANTETADAVQFAERLRGHVEQLNLDELAHDDPCGISTLTVSVGVAGLSREVSTADLLIEEADSALYQAKHDGRNRVVSADPTRGPAPS